MLKICIAGKNSCAIKIVSFLEKKTETQIQLTVREDSQDLVDVICKRSRSYPFENFSFEVDFLGLPHIIDKIDDILRIDTKF